MTGEMLKPSFLVQTVIAVLLAVIGYMANAQFNYLGTQYAALQVDLKQLRADFTALEIGLRGDRFTRTDWTRERKALEEDLDEIRADIARLEEQLNR